MNDDSRLGFDDHENLRRGSRLLTKGHSCGKSKSNSFLSSGSHHLEAPNSDPVLLHPNLSSFQPRWLHQTIFLYFPHTPRCVPKGSDHPLSPLLLILLVWPYWFLASCQYRTTCDETVRRFLIRKMNPRGSELRCHVLAGLASSLKFALE